VWTERPLSIGRTRTKPIRKAIALQVFDPNTIVTFRKIEIRELPTARSNLIQEMSLKDLDDDPKVEQDAEILRSIKTLEKINDQPPAEFWERSDKGE
jgi:hypothetical protein